MLKRKTSKLLARVLSGFRKGHSTETLLIRLLSDIYGVIYKSELILLVPFDVSAAFDYMYVEHDIVLKHSP